MHAVLVNVELPEGGTMEQGRQELESKVIPQVKKQEGFVAGYWLAPPNGRDGLGIVFYRDEQSAQKGADSVTTPPPVKLVSVEVREVAAHATADS